MTQPLMPSSTPAITSVSVHAARYTSSCCASGGSTPSKTNWRGDAERSPLRDPASLPSSPAPSLFSRSQSFGLCTWIAELPALLLSSFASFLRTVGRTRT